MSWTFHFREVTEVTKEVSWNYSESLLLFSQPFYFFLRIRLFVLYISWPIKLCEKPLQKSRWTSASHLQLLGEFGSSCSQATISSITLLCPTAAKAGTNAVETGLMEKASTVSCAQCLLHRHCFITLVRWQRLSQCLNDRPKYNRW